MLKRSIPFFLLLGCMTEQVVVREKAAICGNGTW